MNKNEFEEKLKTLEEKYEVAYEPSVNNSIGELECLETILTCSLLEEPNWLEISNFIKFLDDQLEICEKATWMNPVKGFKYIVIQLVVKMANDFGLPNLEVVQEREPSGGDEEMEIDNENTNALILVNRLDVIANRRWENMIHPYIIFNADNLSVSFISVFALGCWWSK